MFGAFTSFGKLGSLARAIAAAWSPSALWPTGTEPGMWISPSTLPASFNDYLGTTPVATPGTVADSSNPVGLALDLRAGNPVPLGPEIWIDPPIPDPVVAVKIADRTYQFTGVTGYFGSWFGIGQTLGRSYKCSVVVTGLSSGAFSIAAGGVGLTVTSNGSFSNIQTTTDAATGCNIYANGVSAGATVSVSVREIPGNHMLQSTSAARPLMSARVNLFNYSEDFEAGVASGYWEEDGATVSGTNVFSESSGTSDHRVNHNFGSYLVAGTAYTISVRMKQGTTPYGKVVATADGGLVTVNLATGVITGGTGWAIEAMPDGSYILSKSFVFSAYPVIQFGMTNAVGQEVYAGNTANNIQVLGIQLELGTTATPYQAILTDGSSYSSTGFPIYQKYDGTDDGMATATFAAGTLSNAMDCMIAVRRDSGANAVCGLYESVAEANKVFGIAESASGSGCVGSGAGTPTVWVDGTQLTGGTAVTRGTLHTALSSGDIHILEFRGLDLSTWTASGFGLYTSYKLLGARGDIMLYPSAASTEDKDAARQYLADKYGVTLP